MICYGNQVKKIFFLYIQSKHLTGDAYDDCGKHDEALKYFNEKLEIKIDKIRKKEKNVEKKWIIRICKKS